MSEQEKNKQIVSEYVEAFNRLDIDGLRQLFSDDAQIYGVLGHGDFDMAASIWQEINTAFDIKLEVTGMIAEGNVVAVRYIERGTSRGSFRGGPVTGKSFEVVAMEWFEMSDGKIVRRWGARDNAAQIRQMGLPME
jgi:steroid delta-isomerase-like uncharacterized protein